MYNFETYRIVVNLREDLSGTNFTLVSSDSLQNIFPEVSEDEPNAIPDKNLVFKLTREIIGYTP